MRRYVADLAAVFALLFGFFAAGDLLVFISTNKGTSGASQTSSLLAAGWARFFAGVAIIYILLAIVLTVFFLPRASNRRAHEPVGTADMTVAWVYIITLIAALVVPAYALGIYPGLPQQLGGGRVLRVTVVLSSEDVRSQFALATNDLYLVDRAPASTLFLLVDRQTHTYKVIEVATSTIHSITYELSP